MGLDKGSWYGRRRKHGRDRVRGLLVIYANGEASGGGEIAFCFDENHIGEDMKEAGEVFVAGLQEGEEGSKEVRLVYC